MKPTKGIALEITPNLIIKKEQGIILITTPKKGIEIGNNIRFIYSLEQDRIVWFEIIGKEKNEIDELDEIEAIEENDEDDENVLEIESLYMDGDTEICEIDELLDIGSLPDL